MKPFKQGDIFYNIIKTHPKAEFFCNNGTVRFNRQNYEAAASHTPIESVSLFDFPNPIPGSACTSSIFINEISSPLIGTTGVSFGFTPTITSNLSFSTNLSGTLPTGLTLTPATGMISGTPTQAGTFTGFLYTAIDECRSTNSNIFSIVISPGGS